MNTEQLFSKPPVPVNWISNIYPKTDWFWYYMNTDWIEQRIASKEYVDFEIYKITNSESIDSDITLTIENHKIVCDATSNNIIITLPTAVWIEWKEFVITRLDNSANTVTIQPYWSETIYWTSSEVVYQYETLVFASNNINFL